MSTLPTHIARYSVVEPIAAGGMGEVFLARDDRLDRLVAIKLLRDGFDSDDLRSRFEEEARNVAKLTHPNIVTIYEYGAHEGRPYIAMEYVAGYSMADLVRRRMPLSLARRVRLIEELCAGLGHAHKAQLVHRDIKPANLMVSTSGMLKVLDFGIAKLRGTDRTQKGLLVGTVNYMSPEQITGQPVDHRSDIFAVGLVLHEVLTYDQAFKGDLTTAMFAIVHGQPEPLAARCPGLDPGFQLIVSRCLAKSPADRYQDLSVLKRDLGRLRRPLEDDEGELADTIGPFADERTVLANNDAAVAPTEVKAAGPDTRRARESAVAAGEAAIARGQFESALRHAEQALALESDNAAARDLLDRARRALEGAKLDSQIGRVRAALADDRLDEARSGLAAAVALAPDTTLTRDLALQIERREAEIREAAAAAARAAEAQRAAEAEAARLAEAQRAAEAEAARQAEAARVARERERAEVERARLAREAAAAEAARRAEQRRAAEAEAARVAEQQRAADAEAARQAEATRLTRERERAEAERERLAREAEAEAARLAEARRAADAEADRLAAEERAAEAEAARRAEDERRAAEAERVAREQREAEARQRADADRSAPTQYWEAPTIVAAPPATRASAAPVAGPATNDTAIVDAPRWPASRTPEPGAAPPAASTSSSPSHRRTPLVVGGLAATLLLAVWLWPRGPVAEAPTETSPAPAPSPATSDSGTADAPAPPPADLGAAPLSNPGALSEFRTGPEAQPGRREADAPAPAPAPAAPATNTGTNPRPADSRVPTRPSPATPSTSGSASTTRPATPSATGASTPATNTSGPVVAPPATTTTSSPAAPTTRPATGTSTASGATGSSVSPPPAGPRPTPPSTTTAPAEPVASPPRAEPAGGTTTPAPAPAPPPAPPPPPASDGAAARQLDEATIRRLVNAFGQAYASKDLKALRAVWPTMSGGDESSYRNVFNSYRTISWATGDTNIRFEGDRADARSAVQVTQRALRPDTTTTQTRTYRFRMERRGSSWVLVGVENLGAAR